MKKNIHPQWYPQAKVSCACGNTFTVGSTKPEIKVEICSSCHPFFTGKMKFVDIQGRVEKFQARQKTAATYQASQKEKTLKKRLKKEKEKKRPQTLKEMLQRK